MSADYYEILGISRSAQPDEIQKAYRKLARKYHPDLHEDKELAKEKFQQIQHAYDVLSNPKKRQMYDQVGPEFEQMGGGGGNPFGGAGPQIDMSQFFGGGGGGGGIEDILRQFGGMGGMGGAPGGMGGGPGGMGARPGGNQAGQKPDLDIDQSITIPFATAALGGQHQVSFQRSSGRVDTIDVKIPVGIQNGKKIRLRGQGRSDPRGKKGDLLIKVNVASHPSYRRSENNLLVKLPITLSEALLGAKIDLPTPHGAITVTIPPGSTSGKSLRLKGMGIKPANKPPGDLLAEIEVVIPDDLNDAQRQALADVLAEINQGNPRTQVMW